MPRFSRIRGESKTPRITDQPSICRSCPQSRNVARIVAGPKMEIDRATSVVGTVTGASYPRDCCPFRSVTFHRSIPQFLLTTDAAVGRNDSKNSRRQAILFRRLFQSNIGAIGQAQQLRSGSRVCKVPPVHFDQFIGRGLKDGMNSVLAGFAMAMRYRIVDSHARSQPETSELFSIPRRQTRKSHGSVVVPPPIPTETGGSRTGIWLGLVFVPNVCLSEAEMSTPARAALATWTAAQSSWNFVAIVTRKICHVSPHEPRCPDYYLLFLRDPAALRFAGCFLAARRRVGVAFATGSAFTSEIDVSSWAFLTNRLKAWESLFRGS